MRLRIRCPECNSFLECFHIARDDHPDYKRGDLVVVCYQCRAPDGGLQPYVEFKCAKCGEEFDPRILEYSHEVEKHLCPNCHAMIHRPQKGIKEKCPRCQKEFDSSIFDFSHELNTRICSNCHATIHRVEQPKGALRGREEDCPYCLKEQGEMVRGLWTGKEWHFERLLKYEYECPACGQKYAV